MMILGIHIVGISLLVTLVGSLAYNMGLREGERKAKLRQELG